LRNLPYNGDIAVHIYGEEPNGDYAQLANFAIKVDQRLAVYEIQSAVKPIQRTLLPLPGNAPGSINFSGENTAFRDPMHITQQSNGLCRWKNSGIEGLFILDNQSTSPCIFHLEFCCPPNNGDDKYFVLPVFVGGESLVEIQKAMIVKNWKMAYRGKIGQEPSELVLTYIHCASYSNPSNGT
jgi:hypothetical protein